MRTIGKLPPKKGRGKLLLFRGNRKRVIPIHPPPHEKKRIPDTNVHLPYLFLSNISLQPPAHPSMYYSNLLYFTYLTDICYLLFTATYFYPLKKKETEQTKQRELTRT